MSFLRKDSLVSDVGVETQRVFSSRLISNMKKLKYIINVMYLYGRIGVVIIVLLH